ncbi:MULTISPECIES: ribosomal protein S18-alanine N-acetyltransferase [Deefgea]|uniref:[Ribosomal protein bS18]-alanine N-acetyltransferase n=1 Tax=Deefgea chitinilytica TaxID=570276 RepID=A0ABS2CC84_9NEIS|nr:MULTISPECIES: ribosomal protein S18-alanine N-acetyltransferase [Deefgea]MBM5571058.1 ribosomal-protein-alanine N-acetyltransferase [Deefgea chitinilytica]MBM9888288.1 ribosomal protein S18-alanine N-acetyltransferase [Deefgea sp. CFH1-16]
MLKPLTTHHLSDLIELDEATNPHPWTGKQWVDSLENHTCYGWWQGGSLVGFAVCMITLDEAELLLIAISPSLQRKRLGSQLLQAVLQELRVQGVQQLFLEVRESNTAACEFYRRHLFTQSGRRKGYYPTTTSREDALLYTHATMDVA